MGSNRAGLNYGIEIDGQSIGPAKKDVFEDEEIGAIQVSAANVGWTIPLRVENEAPIGVDHNGPRTLQIPQKCPAIGWIACVQNVQRAFATVDVVQVLGCPIQRQSWMFQFQTDCRWCVTLRLFCVLKNRFEYLQLLHSARRGCSRGPFRCDGYGRWRREWHPSSRWNHHTSQNRVRRSGPCAKRWGSWHRRSPRRRGAEHGPLSASAANTWGSRRRECTTSGQRPAGNPHCRRNGSPVRRHRRSVIRCTCGGIHRYLIRTDWPFAVAAAGEPLGSLSVPSSRSSSGRYSESLNLLSFQ